MRDKEIKAHNQDLATTSTCGHNYMSDYTENELTNMKGYKTSTPRVAILDDSVSNSAYQSDMINWVSKGKVTAVQNQGQCGSCWTFSASGAISSAIAIANNSTPVDYSEQQIIDCDTGGNGCKGGDME